MSRRRRKKISLEALRASRDRLEDELSRLVRKLERCRESIRVAEYRARRAAAAAVDLSALAVACVSCDVGPGAACIWPKSKAPAPPAPPFHKARLRSYETFRALEKLAPRDRAAQLPEALPARDASRASQDAPASSRSSGRRTPDSACAATPGEAPPETIAAAAEVLRLPVASLDAMRSGLAGVFGQLDRGRCTFYLDLKREESRCILPASHGGACRTGSEIAGSAPR